MFSYLLQKFDVCDLFVIKSEESIALAIYIVIHCARIKMCRYYRSKSVDSLQCIYILLNREESLEMKIITQRSASFSLIVYIYQNYCRHKHRISELSQAHTNTTIRHRCAHMREPENRY